MKQQIILIVLLSFVCVVAAASDEYCSFNPSGECPGVRADTAQKSGDTFFYCDTGASMFGSDTCRYLGTIDGRYPVSTGVCPNGYPILFFSTGVVSDLSVDVHYVNCLDYGCTEVTEPRLLPQFNGLYAVDTATVRIHDVDTLVVAGVGDQLSAGDLNSQQNPNTYSVQYPQYYVTLAFSTDEMCSNFTVNQPDVSNIPVLNARVTPKLVEIIPTNSPSFSYGLSYVSASLSSNDPNEVADNNQINWRAARVPKGLYSRSEADNKDTRFAIPEEADKSSTTADATDDTQQADKSASEQRPNNVLGLRDRRMVNAHFQVMISCYEFCETFYPTLLWVPASRYLSQFSSDLPWTNNYPALNQESDAEASQFTAAENFYRTLPDSPFSYNTFIPRPLILHNKKGDFFFGLQGVQRMPQADIRGLDECGNIEDPESPDFREQYPEVEQEAEGIRFTRQAAQLSQTLFGGTTNIRFYRCPSETEEEQESPGICDNLFEEEEAPLTAPIPHPSASLQYSGRSTIHGYQLRDANEEVEDETPSENAETTNDENSDYTDMGPYFWTETATSNVAFCQESYGGPGPINKQVATSDDAGHKSAPGVQKYLGGSRPTRTLGGSRATRSAPRSLTAGLAGNGYPAVVGISTVSTGEPSAAGWSLVLTICLTDSCDQQVFRYLMDSSALHDNWGIMDDPFAAVNKILNHPDGSWSIILFVQPQGEQIDRHTDLPRGEGSTGKPLIVNCLDETCSSAYVSLLAPNRLQSSIPNELSFYTLPGIPVINNDVHSFTYVGESSEYLLVTVRDLPQGPSEYGPSVNGGLPNYSPSSVRLWKTNRYASPTGYPCTAESVGTMETIDGSLFICTRLNTGHDLTMGDISGWVRYYEWVDVGHSFASRLWANLPAGRSPLDLANNNVGFPTIPLTSGLNSKAVLPRSTKQTKTAATSNPSVDTALVAGQPLDCCDQQVWVPAPGQHTDIALASTLYQPTVVKIYFSSLDVPSMLPLAGFYVSLLNAQGESTPILKGFRTLIHGAELYCQVLVIPVPAAVKVPSASALRVGLSFLQTSSDACESDAQPCQIAIAGVEVLASTQPLDNTPYFAPFPAELTPVDAKPGSWACPAPQ